jgi:hypothetical protein
MKIDYIAKQLANKVNQEHYIKHYLEKVQRGAYNKGIKDTEAKQLILSGVSKSVCVQTGLDCGFPCHSECPLYEKNKGCMDSCELNKQKLCGNTNKNLE